jgi:hypothetical protein
MHLSNIKLASSVYGSRIRNALKNTALFGGAAGLAAPIGFNDAWDAVQKKVMDPLRSGLKKLDLDLTDAKANISKAEEEGINLGNKQNLINEGLSKSTDKLRQLESKRMQLQITLENSQEKLESVKQEYDAIVSKTDFIKGQRSKYYSKLTKTYEDTVAKIEARNADMRNTLEQVNAEALQVQDKVRELRSEYNRIYELQAIKDMTRENPSIYTEGSLTDPSILNSKRALRTLQKGDLKEYNLYGQGPYVSDEDSKGVMSMFLNKKYPYIAKYLKSGGRESTDHSLDFINKVVKDQDAFAEEAMSRYSPSVIDTSSFRDAVGESGGYGGFGVKYINKVLKDTLNSNPTKAMDNELYRHQAIGKFVKSPEAASEHPFMTGMARVVNILRANPLDSKRSWFPTNLFKGRNPSKFYQDDSPFTNWSLDKYSPLTDGLTVAYSPEYKSKNNFIQQFLAKAHAVDNEAHRYSMPSRVTSTFAPRDANLVNTLVPSGIVKEPTVGDLFPYFTPDYQKKWQGGNLNTRHLRPGDEIHKGLYGSELMDDTATEAINYAKPIRETFKTKLLDPLSEGVSKEELSILDEVYNALNRDELDSAAKLLE